MAARRAARGSAGKEDCTANEVRDSEAERMDYPLKAPSDAPKEKTDPGNKERQAMDLKQLITWAVIAAVLAVLTAAVTKLKGNGAWEPPRARKLLTAREIEMHKRLRAALPDHMVMAQVAFSALITATTRAARNRFDRKVCDFLILDATYTPIAVVELDDASHAGRDRQDAKREALLTNAGYKVIRFKKMPTEKEISERLNTGMHQTRKVAIIDSQI
jgi:very-short-patch-repair endonuclease